MKFKSLAVALVCALGVSFLAGCGGSGPKDIAQDGMKALISGDVEAYKKVAANSSTAELAVPLASGLFKAAGATFESLTFGEPVVNGDEAAVPFSCSIDGSSGNIKLKKVDGDWKFVDFK